MQQTKFKYTILKNMDGKYWLWFDEKGSVIEGKYVPNLKPYHEIETRSVLRDGAEIWTDDLTSIPESCQLRPFGEYSEAYVVKARINDESKFLADCPAAVSGIGMSGHIGIPGKKPGMGKQ